MELTTVSSSNITGIGWEKEKLEIHFTNGTAYEYSNVPREVYTALLRAKSKGKYFAANIKNTYWFKQIKE